MTLFIILLAYLAPASLVKFITEVFALFLGYYLCPEMTYLLNYPNDID